MNKKTKNASGQSFLSVLRPQAVRIILIFVLSIASSAVDSVYPLFQRYAINHFIADKILTGIGVFTAMYLFVLILQSVAGLISTVLCGRTELGINTDLRSRLFAHLQQVSFSYYNRNNVGSIHSRIMSDTARIGEVFAWQFMEFVWNAGYIAFVIVNMLLISPRLTFPLLVLYLVIILVSVVYQWRLYLLGKKRRKQNAVITGEYSEAISGSLSLKVLGIEERQYGLFRKDTRKQMLLGLARNHVFHFFQATITFGSSMILALVVYKGGLIAEKEVMEIGTLTVFFAYAIGSMDPVSGLVRLGAEFIEAKANWERIREVLAEPLGVQDSPEVIEKYGDSFHPKKENWEPLYGDVEFDHVSFTYPDGEEEVLNDFNLKVPKGSMIAIVGETGAGKSTLVNLVCRFYEPTEGRILIDGRDVKERSELWLHSHIGYVLQTPYLFAGSVRENLCYGRPDATDEQIWEALSCVSADEIVKDLEHGLDTEVGEGGLSLSSGQKQLLSFARAILADPAILILDEATANVDTLTERRIQEAISKLTSERTSFVIAHRLSTIVDADRIIAVRDGKIEEAGTHRELMEKKGYYYNLYMRQFEDIDRIAEEA